jgi:hypothetical protein
MVGDGWLVAQPVTPDGRQPDAQLTIMSTCAGGNRARPVALAAGRRSATSTSTGGGLPRH